MVLLARRPRSVYEVYPEAEYLAGADLGPERTAHTPQAWRREPADSRRGVGARRLAGAAALTGAVGVVGTLLGLALLRVQPMGRNATLAKTHGSRSAAVRRSTTYATLLRRLTVTPARRLPAGPAHRLPSTLARDLQDRPARAASRVSRPSDRRLPAHDGPASEDAAATARTLRTASADSPAAPASPVGTVRTANAVGSPHREFGFER